jgi:type II secretion system protein G
MLRREKGFTLIELLIVVAIIGIIAAIAVPNLLAAIQRSKRSRTAADMRAIGTALGSYQVDNNIYPIAAAGPFVRGTTLESKYYEGSDKDAWNLAFQYTCTDGSSYTLESYGKNKVNAVTNSEFDSDVVFMNGQFTEPVYWVNR